MNTLANFQNKDTGLLLQRLSIGILILFHGIANLTSNYSFIKSLLIGIGIPEFVAYSVFIGEIIAPILIIIGWRAKLASLVLALNMLIAILMAHSADVFTLNQFNIINAFWISVCRPPVFTDPKATQRENIMVSDY